MKKLFYNYPQTRVMKMETDAILFPESSTTPDPAPARRDIISYQPLK